MTRRILRLAAALLASTVNPLEAGAIVVPTDQPTIQAAIDAAGTGDIVLVAPGTYFENIDFKGKAITVTSEQGPEVTVIDGNHLGAVVTFASGEGPASVLSGFTIQHGRNSLDEGGGINVQNSSPVISGNVITGNRGCGGGGIKIIFGSPTVIKNLITGNDASGCSGGRGGGVSVQGNSAAEIRRNVISNNKAGDAGGIFLNDAGTPTIKNNVISGNSVFGIPGEGGGMQIMNASNALIIQNVITNNKAGQGGGISWGARPVSRAPCS